MQVGIGAMQSIISAASQNRTRVVLNLSRRADYTTSVSGNHTGITTLVIVKRQDAKLWQNTIPNTIQVSQEAVIKAGDKNFERRISGGFRLGMH